MERPKVSRRPRSNWFLNGNQGGYHFSRRVSWHPLTFVSLGFGIIPDQHRSIESIPIEGLWNFWKTNRRIRHCAWSQRETIQPVTRFPADLEKSPNNHQVIEDLFVLSVFGWICFFVIWLGRNEKTFLFLPTAVHWYSDHRRQFNDILRSQCSL